MREKIIEEKLTKAVQQNGGVCWKFTSPGTAGVPDRWNVLHAAAATAQARHATPPNLAKEFRQSMQFDDFPEMAKKFCPQCGTKITDHMGRPRSFCSECSFIIV